MSKKSETGFTLVEIAIVIAIVGLLIGGVLKGQEMLTNSKLKRIESDQSEIMAAMAAYQDRYMQMPGDDDRASLRFSVYSDGVDDPAANEINGSGDGFLDGNWMATANTETANVWKHLRASGLIDGGADDETQPTHAYGGTIGIRDGSLNLAGTTAVFASLEGPVMRIIEDRHDDGSPASGRIQSELTAVQMDGNTASTAGSTYSDDARYFVAFRL